MKKIINFLQKNNNVINKLTVLALFIYYVLAFMPSFQTLEAYESILITNSTISFIYRIIVFSLMIIVIVCCLLANKIKPSYLALTLCLFYLLFSAISIVLFGNGERITAVDGETQMELLVGISTKISSFLSALRNTIIIYSFINVFSVIAKKDNTLFLIKLFLFYSFFVVIYSFVFEFNEVINLFKSSSGYSSEITSIFTNKNAYGVFIFSICMLLLVYYKITNFKYKKFLFAYYIFFIAYSFLIYCRTTFMVLLIGLIIYAYSIFLSGKNKNGNKIIIIMSIIIGLITTFITLFNVVPSLRASTIGKFISSYTVSLSSSLLDGNGRLEIWISYFTFLTNPFSIVFGYGDTISNAALKIITSINNYQYLQHSAFHNGLIQILASGGLIRLFIYIYTIYKYSISILRKSKIRSVLYIALVCFIIYQSFESLILLTADYQTWIMTILFFVVPSSLTGEDCNQGLIDGGVLIKNKLSYKISI